MLYNYKRFKNCLKGVREGGRGEEEENDRREEEEEEEEKEV